MSAEPIIIIGAGQAGVQLAASLRQEGVGTRIVLINDEGHLPYQRPPLSKAYLLGKADLAQLAFRPANYFDDQRIERLEGAVAAINPATRCLRLSDGQELGYGHLVLATGARNRPLPLEGADLAGVYGLRNLGDADQLKVRLEAAQRVVVIGAGFIGLEFAAVASGLGKAVHVIEMAPRVMGRAVSAEISAFFAQAHHAWGAELHSGQSVAALRGEAGQVTGVVLSDGREIAADLVVYGIGVLPNDDLARGAGLSVENGVRVDGVMATSDPAISALGDCAAFPCVQVGQTLRLESVQNAADQARLLAQRLAGKAVAPYAALPWFWSDQGDLKLQIAGLSLGHDQVVTLGQPESRSFSTLLFRGDQLVAVESVNRPTDFMIARKLLAGDRLPLPREARAPDFDLRAFAMQKP